MFRKATQWFMVLLLALVSTAFIGPLAFAQDDDSVAELEITIPWPGLPDGDVLVIGGLSFDLATAEIDDDLQIGELARIHASLSGDGVWVVREVSHHSDDDDDGGNDNANDNDNDDNGNDNDDDANDNGDDGNDNDDDDDRDSLEFRGRLDEIGAGFIVVAGVTFDTSTAEMDDDLFVGAPVRVHAIDMSGVLVAREVSLDLDDDDDDIVIGDDCVAAMPAGWTTYTIQPGDTLSGIASGSDTSVAVLMLVNCIADPGLISAGATIFVPFAPVSDDDDDANDNDDDANDNDDDANDNDDDANDNGDDDANDNGDDDANDNDGDDGNDDANDNDGDDGNDNGDDANDNGDDDGNDDSGDDDSNDDDDDSGDDGSDDDDDDDND